jgi:O-antigen ligase
VGGIIFVSSRGFGNLNLKGKATVEGGDSFTTRQEMWSETWQMLGDNWWTGAGLASYPERVAPYHQKDYIEIYLYPHNVIFNFWSEIGLVGLIGFVLMVVCFFVVPLKNLAKQDRVKVLILKAGMFVLLVHGLVDVPYFKNDLAVLWWMILVGALITNNE